MAPQRRTIRLPEPVYRQPGQISSVTIGTAPRRPIFGDIPLGLECVDRLEQLCESTNAHGFAYCLMPDHAHLLIGVGDRQSLSAIVGEWKSLCYRARRGRGFAEKFWQRSFYDHALRREEDLRVAARYILENPVRAGLVREVRDYPLSGSFEFDLS